MTLGPKGEFEHVPMSAGQLWMSRFLSGLGHEVIPEQWVAQRRVDCYLPKLNIAVEYDGPTHWSKKVEANRDSELLEAGLRGVIHIRDSTPEEATRLYAEITQYELN